MPLCDVGRLLGLASEGGTQIFYQTYGRGKTKVLLIPGLAATHDSWGPQIRGLAGANVPKDAMGDDAADGMEVCSFDNRGMGRSSVPSKKTEYTTTIMAEDALAVMDHLGWSRAHVVGHSMGAMVSCKLAALAPGRILSLALLNVTGGGFECFPKIDGQTLSLAFRFLRASTPEQRAAVDLDTHYSKEYLDAHVGSETRRKILYQEYVTTISSTGMQSTSGFEGQANACWTHKMSAKELELIRTSGFPISIIHGRYDIVAQLCYARNLAQKLQPSARMIELHGAHLVSHERADEVNQALRDLIWASEAKWILQNWSNIPQIPDGMQGVGISILLRSRSHTGESLFTYSLDMLAKSFFYLFGVIILAFERSTRVLRRLQPARVGSTQS